MPPQLSLSSTPASYLSDIKALLNFRETPANDTRAGLLRSLLVRSVRINLVGDGHVQLPLRVRPALIILNVIDLTLLGLLGFHPSGSSIPINDKVLHFVCFLVATALFYAIWDVDESARRHSSLWRRIPLILSFVVCFLVGGIGSEFVQALLPSKHFDAFDILANLVGSSLGLWLSYHAEKRYRLNREVRRLYRPLDPEEYGDDVEDLGLMEDEDEDEGTNHYGHHHAAKQTRSLGAQEGRNISNVGDVWSAADDDIVGAGNGSGGARQGSSRTDLFSIEAEDSGEEEEGSAKAPTSASIPVDDSQKAWERGGS